MNKEYIGMWRYALTKKLRKRINKVATLKLCLKLDENTWSEGIHTHCGTNLYVDCPFHVPSKNPQTLGYCLAPNVDSYWHEEMKRQREFISPRYGDKVVGCYLQVFAKKGYENYLRIQAWKRRSKVNVKGRKEDTHLRCSQDSKP